MAAQTSGIPVARSTRLVSPKGRASYPHLFKPSAYKGEGEPKFSVSLMLDKKASTTKPFIDKIRAAQEAALADLYGKKMPQNLERWGITDGDESEATEMHGHWIIKGSAKTRPAVIDSAGTEILEESAVYGGCYGRINVCAKAYGTASKGGVTLELNVFQKVADGEAFGGVEKAKQSAVAEMGVYEEESEF